MRKIKFWKSCAKPRFCEDFPVTFELAHVKKKRPCLDLASGAALQGQIRWIWRCCFEFWMPKISENTKKIHRKEQKLFSLYESHQGAQHLGFIRKHTLNWHHLFLKAEFGPATSTSSLTYCTRALPYMCCCVVRWIVLQRGCQAAVINSDRNVSASCSNLQVSAIT